MGDADEPETAAAKFATREKDHIEGINQRNTWKLQVDGAQKKHLQGIFDADTASRIVKTWRQKIEEVQERGLKRVDLTQRLTEPGEANAFLKWLEKDESIAEIDAPKAVFAEEDWPLWAPALKNNGVLTELNLTDCQIGDVGIKHFAQGLAANHSLRVLNFSTNKIGAEGSKDLAKAFHVNQTVADINLFRNPVGTEGASAFATMLSFNQGLQALSLAACSISLDGIQALAEAIGENTSLWHFFLWGNGVPASDPSMLKIKAKLEANMEAATVVKKFKGQLRGINGADSSSSSGSSSGSSESGEEEDESASASAAADTVVGALEPLPQEEPQKEQ
mmetsp:Transcript_2289/g.4777  ORF Transcript_2289/g.4777 Transcript_2289/m.4777 type:complete len:335 (+) Transcript_2289:154-1158(+)